MPRLVKGILFIVVKFADFSNRYLDSCLLNNFACSCLLNNFACNSYIDCCLLNNFACRVC